MLCCVSLIIGVGITSFLPLELAKNYLWWFIGMMAGAVALVMFWKKEKVRIAALVGLFLFLGIWRYGIGLPADTPDKIWYYNGQVVDIQGYVCNEPDVRSKSQKLEVCVKTVGTKDFAFAQTVGTQNLAFIHGKVLVTTSLYPSWEYGDQVNMTCELKAPERFRGFSYDRYLARFDIYSVCYFPEIDNVSDKTENTPWRVPTDFYKIIFKIKDKLRDVIEFGLEEPESSLARAIILGDKKGIPDDLRTKFSQAGLSHIVAISGMHISILAALVMGLLLQIGLARKHAFWAASLLLLLYILLIGLPASAMRAGLMGFLVLWAMNLGRLNKLTNSLVLAGAVLLLINPRLLRDDIGFQLSFLAVMGIAYAYPLLEKWINALMDLIESRRKKSRDSIGRSFLAPSRMTKVVKVVGALVNITLAAQVFTLPILAMNFSQVSVISPISNLLVLWTLPLLMVSVLAGIGLSLLIPSYGFLFFLPAWLLLKYIIFVTNWIIRMPYAYIEIDYLWWGWIIVYYVVVVWLVIKFRKN